jgi:hypothetical protein
MPRIDHVNQTRTQQVTLFLRVRTVFHDQNRNCRFSAEIIQNPAGRNEKNATFQGKITNPAIVQGEHLKR